MKSTLAFFVFTIAFFSATGQALPKVYQELQRAYDQGNFQACVKLSNDVELFASRQKDTLVSNSFAYLADAHNQLGEHEKAIAWLEREKAMLAEIGMAQTDYSSVNLYNLASAYLEIGSYAKAGVTATELIANDRKVFGVSSEEFAQSALSAADIYLQIDKFGEAERLLQSTLRQQQKGSLMQGKLWDKLGELYSITSQYSKASKALNSSLAIMEKVAGINSTEYIATSINLGILYMSQGKYAEAEELFDYVIKEIGPRDDSYPAVLNIPQCSITRQPSIRTSANWSVPKKHSVKYKISIVLRLALHIPITPSPLPTWAFYMPMKKSIRKPRRC
jgi:tetratricopeptide (TPR) repeat protein